MGVGERGANTTSEKNGRVNTFSKDKNDRDKAFFGKKYDGDKFYPTLHSEGLRCYSRGPKNRGEVAIYFFLKKSCPPPEAYLHPPVY